MTKKKEAGAEEAYLQAKNSTLKYLSKYFKMWQQGLRFKQLFPRVAYHAKRADMNLEEFAQRLEEEGLIMDLSSPKGSRYILPGDCGWTEAQIVDFLVNADYQSEMSKK